MQAGVKRFTEGKKDNTIKLNAIKGSGKWNIASEVKKEAEQ